MYCADVKLYVFVLEELSPWYEDVFKSPAGRSSRRKLSTQKNYPQEVSKKCFYFCMRQERSTISQYILYVIFMEILYVIERTTTKSSVYWEVGWATKCRPCSKNVGWLMENKHQLPNNVYWLLTSFSSLHFAGGRGSEL